MSTNPPVTALQVVTAVACSTAAATAYGGAIGLISGGLSLDPAVGARLPFASLPVAGLALLGFVAAPMSVATVAVLRRQGQTPTRVLAAGVLLIIWIAIELLFLQTYAWLQPVYLLLGTAVVCLAWRLGERLARPGRRRPDGAAPDRPQVDVLGRI